MWSTQPGHNCSNTGTQPPRRARKSSHLALEPPRPGRGPQKRWTPRLGRPWWWCSGSPGEAAAPLLPWRRSADTQDPSAPDRLLLGPRRGSAEDPTMGAGSTSKNGCCKASAAVIREPGSHIRRRKMRSMAGWPSGRGRTTSRDANFSLGASLAGGSLKTPRTRNRGGGRHCQGHASSGGPKQSMTACN